MHSSCLYILTNASVANSAVTGIGVVACSIICAVATTAISTSIVVGIITVSTTATVAANWMIVHAAGYCCDHPVDPFTGNMPNAAPKSSSSSPSCVCGYQNRACYDTP